MKTRRFLKIGTSFLLTGLLAVLTEILIHPFSFADSPLSLTLKQGSGWVEFHATGHPSAIRITGKGDKLQGNLFVNHRTVTGQVQFDLSSLNTGIEVRTRHMKEKYLEISQYPEAKFTLTQMELSQDLTGNTSMKQVPFQGKLFLHGIEKLISGTAEIQTQEKQVKFNAEFSLKIGDYGIVLPTFAGITMADEVKILVQDTTRIQSAN